MNKNPMLPVCMVLFLTGLASPPCEAAPIRVGVYQNEPKVFVGDDGTFKGIYPDILKSIASKEGWQTQYVPGTWQQCLDRLEKGEIDILVDVAYSKQRAERYDFNKETVLSNWAQVYAQPDSNIQSILDMQGKRVAVVSDGLFYNEFRSLAEKFEIEYVFVELDSFSEVFRAIHEKNADVGLIGHLFGLRQEAKYDVERTPVVFCPVEIRFAVPKGQNRAMVEAIDKHLVDLKKNKQSPYYQSIDKWLGVGKRRIIPAWLKWTLASSGGLLLLFAAICIVLRTQVRAKTTDLSAKNMELSKVNRALAMLSRSNQALIHATEESQLLRDVCRIAVEDGGYQLAWIGFAEQDEEKTVRPVAHEGYKEGYLDTANITWADNEQGRGPTGAAIRTGEPCVARNILTNPDFEPWQSEARKRGYQSSIALPLGTASLAFGALNIYASEPDAFDAEEISLLQELAEDLAYGITSLRLRIEHDRAEEALKKSEKMYRAAIEVAGAVPYYQDYATNKYEFIGEGIKPLTGYSPEEFTPEVWTGMELELVLLGNLKGLPPKQAVAKARGSEGVSWRADYHIRTRDGQERWLSNAAVQVRDEHGQVVGSLGILQDVTERKNLEVQFLQSQKMEAVGQLAGGVAHDFNNLLMVIGGYSDFLMNKLPQDSPMRADLGQIRKAQERAASLTRQLLAFSRRQVLKPQTLNLNTLLDDIHKMLARLIGEDIEVVTLKASDLGLVKVDPGQIEQVLMNLAVNARDAMPQGGKITIETQNVDLDESYTRGHMGAKPGPHVMLAVSDTGVG
ncbi:MAG: transporter substrate-binding domain-containing protein, partial [bacterium]